MIVTSSIAAAPGPADGAASRPLFAVAAVIVSSFLANFDTRLFSIALPDLRGAFSLSYDEGAWLSTASTASQIIIAPAVAWMVTVLGLRRVLGIPSLLYALISFSIPYAQSYPALLALNIVHSLLLATFVPATLLIILRSLPVKWWVPAIAIYSFRVGFTLNSGVAIVGLYVDSVGWQWLYWQDVLIAPLMGLFVYLGIPSAPVNRTVLVGADWGGMLLLGVGMAMIFAGLDQGNRLDWLASGTVVSLLGCGALLVTGFFINEAVVRRPWASADVILSRNIGVAFVVVTLYVLSSLSGSLLTPNFLLSVAQLRAAQLGPLFLLYGVLPMILITPISIYLVRRLDPRWVLLAGLFAFAMSGLLGTRLTDEWSTGDFIPSMLVQSLGQSLTLFPAMIVALSNSDPARSTAFAAYIQVVRLGSIEVGTSVMGTWLRTREQMFSSDLGRHVAVGDAGVQAFLAKIASDFSSYGAGLAPARAVGILSSLIQRQANTLAYIDGFWLTVWFAIAALLVAALLKAAPPGPFSPRNSNPSR
jgi:MFS transporter, DHA2 family, multidrug resistance protein